MCFPWNTKKPKLIKVIILHIDGSEEHVKKPQTFFTESWIAETLGSYKLKAAYLNYDEEILYAENASKWVNEKASALLRHPIKGAVLQVPKGFQLYKLKPS